MCQNISRYQSRGVKCLPSIRGKREELRSGLHRHGFTCNNWSRVPFDSRTCLPTSTSNRRRGRIRRHAEIHGRIAACYAAVQNTSACHVERKRHCTWEDRSCWKSSVCRRGVGRPARVAGGVSPADEQWIGACVHDDELTAVMVCCKY